MINAFFSALKKIIIINNNKSYALFSHYIYFLSEFIEQLSSFHWTHPLQVWMHVKCKNVWHLSRTKNLKSYPDVFLTTADLYFQPRGPIKKRPPIRANTADEAIEKMLEQKRISTKINYDVLKDLNVKSGASPARKAESPKKEPTATKLTGRNRKPARPPLSLSTPLSTLGKRCVYSMLNNFWFLSPVSLFKFDTNRKTGHPNNTKCHSFHLSVSIFDDTFITAVSLYAKTGSCCFLRSQKSIWEM